MNLIEALRRSGETGEQFTRPSGESFKVPDINPYNNEPAKYFVFTIEDILADDWEPVPMNRPRTVTVCINKNSYLAHLYPDKLVLPPIPGFIDEVWRLQFASSEAVYRGKNEPVIEMKITKEGDVVLLEWIRIAQLKDEADGMEAFFADRRLDAGKFPGDFWIYSTATYQQADPEPAKPPIRIVGADIAPDGTITQVEKTLSDEESQRIRELVKTTKFTPPLDFDDFAYDMPTDPQPDFVIEEKP